MKLLIAILTCWLHGFMALKPKQAMRSGYWLNIRGNMKDRTKKSKSPWMRDFTIAPSKTKEQRELDQITSDRITKLLKRGFIK